MASFESLSGLAGEIRSSLVSEQYDLSGYTEVRTRDLVTSAFSTPLTAPTEMVRFTFVVGGGKLVRSRYPEELTKWMTAALRDIGFVEDRSAAETFDSQGTFKQQHDTGQNLKYLIVYPRVAAAEVAAAAAAAASAAAPAESAGSRPRGESVSAVTGGDRLDARSPASIVLASEVSTLRDIITSKTQSWSQVKRMLKCVQDSKENFQAIEAKLVTGAALTPSEQRDYDANNGQDDEKISLLQAECKRYVDTGKVTIQEKEDIIAAITASIAALDVEIAEATQENKAKKLEKLMEKKQALQTKKSSVSALTAVVHRLKLSEEIQRVKVQLMVLSALEDKAKSLSLTMQDLKTLEQKSDLEEELQRLQSSSRGWFESEAEFNAMLALDERDAKVKYANRPKPKPKTTPQQSKRPGGSSTGTSGGGGGGAGGGAAKPKTVYTASSVAGNSWSSIGVKKNPAPGAAKKAGGGAGGGSAAGFAAAFGGNDSDSD